MQVADLLELEGAFAADRRAHAAAHEQRAAGILARLRRLLDRRAALGQDALDLLGGVGELAEQQTDLVHLQLALDLRQQHGKQRERDHLAQERLRGGHGDLLVGLRVDDAVGLPRHGASDHVGDAEHARALHAGVADGRQRVGRFAGLGHRHHERGGRDDGVAIAELACDLALAGDARPALDEVLRDKAGMVAGAARDDVNTVDEVELFNGKVQLIDGKSTAHQTARQRVADDARLLVDLLEHEVGVSALLGHVEVPVNVRDPGIFDDLASGGVVRHALGRELGQLAIVHDHHVARGVDHGDDVAGNIGAFHALAHHQRGVLARGHDGARLIGGHDGQRIGAHQTLACGTNGGQQVGRAVAQRLLDQMRHHFGVGVAGEGMPRGLQLLAQVGEVLDDAVVHHGDAAVAAGVRMGVGLARAAVRGPTRVADAARALEVEVPQRMGQAGNLALAVHHLKLAILVDGHSGAIVAAILKARQALD